MQKSIFKALVFALIAFTASAFAQTVAIAHVSYGNRIALYYSYNEGRSTYNAATRSDDGTYTIEFADEDLANGKKDVCTLKFAQNCTMNTCRTSLNPDNTPTLGELFPEYKENSIINGEYAYPKEEVWIVINKDKTLTISNTQPIIFVTPKKYIRFLTPWTNTNAMMFLSDSENDKLTVNMGATSYCGWYEARIDVPSDGAKIYFKQTTANNFVGANGITENESSLTPIAMDSILALSDTVWIVGRKSGSPEMHTNYPGILSDCPIKTLPVMMFDWLHGNKGDAKNGVVEGTNGDPANGVSADFGSGGCSGLTVGMVEPTLGANGVPVRATYFPENCKITDHLNQWFLPEVLAQKNGVSYTNATCRSIELGIDTAGFWLGQKDQYSAEGGLFLLDDFEYLDEAKTIKNPYFDALTSSTNKKHNYGFTMKIQASFEYIPGQYFEFFGDDDVWVFINNRLVVDIGGQHAQVFGSVNLDTLGLVQGSIYPFHLFYAERHLSASNFMMRTSIDLKIPSNIKVKDLSTDPTLIKKEIWQNVHENTLACDFSVSADNMPTELGPSQFTLFGSNLSTAGLTLEKLDSAYYSGITISNNYTTLTIDTKSISQAQSLSPGTYYVRSSLKSDSNAYEDVYFTVSTYQATSSSSTKDNPSSSNSKSSGSSASGKSSSSKKISSSSAMSNDEIPNFYVRMTGAFEFEIVMEESLPNTLQKYAVMDMMGQVISVGELSEKGAHVTVPTSGAYVVKSGLSYKRINIR
jgi:fibro-slime domain-containing protein